MAVIHNLFISHSWTYGDAYEKLCDMLNAAPRFSYRNYSIPKDDPVHTRGSDEALYEAIKAKMRFCDVVLIMAGKYATFSRWIRREVKIAQDEFVVSKPIIGIRPWANEQVSSVVADNAKTLVGWNTDSIVRAIREYGR